MSGRVRRQTLLLLHMLALTPSRACERQITTLRLEHAERFHNVDRGSCGMSRSQRISDLFSAGDEEHHESFHPVDCSGGGGGCSALFVGFACSGDDDHDAVGAGVQGGACGDEGGGIAFQEEGVAERQE